jgi:hypothetical protein
VAELGRLADAIETRTFAAGVGLYKLLTSPDPQLKGAWYPSGFNPCTYQVKNRFQSLPFKCNLYRYSGESVVTQGEVGGGTS